MCWIKSKNGQISIEYAAIAIIIVAALIAGQFYLRRALLGRLRSSADRIGEQYDPRRTTSNVTARVDRHTKAVVQIHQPLTVQGREGYATWSKEYILQDQTNRQGAETVGSPGKSIWR